MSKRKGNGKDAEGEGAKDGAGGICVAAHPRSATAVARAKGYGGLSGALLSIVLGLGAGLPLLDVMVRGLAGGIVGYISLWAIAVAVARQLVVAEVRARYAARVQAATAAADADHA